MKKYFLLSNLIAFLVYGCTQNDFLETYQSVSNGKQFTTAFESKSNSEKHDSRVYINEENELNWTKGDYISIFNGNTLNSFYQFDGETGDKSGIFSHVHTLEGIENDLNTNYAIYPYDSDVSISGSGVITATLPEQQNYVENSFGLGDNTMVAVTEDINDTFLNFKNVCGYLKLQLYGENLTIKSILLEGNNNEKIAGKTMITPVYGQAPTISMADDATEIITLDCGEGIKIGSTIETATTFWFVVPPTTFEKGFTITITKNNGINLTKSTSNKIVIERNAIKPMKAVSMSSFVMEEVPNNQIWYTSSDGNIVNPKFVTNPNFNSNPFGAMIISNTYVNGKGIITFDDELTTIGENAFYQCKTLTSVVIPNSVTTIGRAFSECESLTSVIIPNSVTIIEKNAFAHCRSLTDVKIPDKLTSIEEYTFYNCRSLKEFTIPNTVTNIGNYAFYQCLELTSITIPNNVTSIGNSAFGCCSSLTSIVVENNNPVYDSRENCNGIVDKRSNKLILACKNTVIPESVTSIGYSAFRGCSKMTDITIPNNVISIEDWAFDMCHSLTNITIPNSVTSIGNYVFYNCNSLTEITIPNSVTSIGDYTFLYCSSLNQITIPNSVKSIGTGPFMGCNSLTSINVENGNPIYDSREDCNAIIETATNTLIQGCITTVIPISVTAIGNDAFSVCSDLKEIVIPNSITSIGNNAFDYCTSLTEITIPSNVTNIGNEAFWDCSSLIKVYVKATTPPIITSDTFKNCRSDLKIYVPAASLEAYKTESYWKDMNILPENQ